MEDKQTRKLNMGVAVLSGLNEPESDTIINANPTAVAKRDQLENELVAIEQADAEQQATSSGGEAIAKEEAKHNMADQADIIAQALCGVALDLNDHVLYEQMNKHASGIFSMKDIDAGALCHLILDKANLHIAALATYNVTITEVNAFSAAIQTFEQSDAAPRNAQVAHHTATTNVSLGLVAMMKTLIWWDHFVATLRITQHDFYLSYKSWRKIVDIGVRHMSVRGLVTDSLTATPLYKVKVTVTGAPTAAHTGKTGKYHLFSLDPGVYTITFALTGYQTLIVPNVSVLDGKITELNISLVKL